MSIPNIAFASREEAEKYANDLLVAHICSCDGCSPENLSTFKVYNLFLNNSWFMNSWALATLMVEDQLSKFDFSDESVSFIFYLLSNEDIEQIELDIVKTVPTIDFLDRQILLANSIISRIIRDE